MTKAEDAICEMLVDRLAEMRKRRATFERMGSDDAVRNMDALIDVVKRVADDVMTIVRGA